MLARATPVGAAPPRCVEDADDGAPRGTCRSAGSGGSAPAPRIGVRSPSSPSTTARTSVASSGRTIPGRSRSRRWSTSSGPSSARSAGGDRDPARSRDRCRPGRRRWVAPARLRAARGDRGDRVRRSDHGPDEPGARRLERGQGQADGRLGRPSCSSTTTPTPRRRPTRSGSSRRWRPTAAPPTWRCSSSRCRTRSTRPCPSWPARRAGGWSSRRRAGWVRSAATS